MMVGVLWIRSLQETREREKSAHNALVVTEKSKVLHGESIGDKR